MRIGLRHSPSFLAGLATTGAIFSTGGCASYEPMPATNDAVMAALSPIPQDDLARAAAALQHPLLPPVTIGRDGSLTPQGAAVVTVLQNPSLKALRSRRGVAEAQLLQAGILPNPQLSASLDFPAFGNTQDTITAYGLGATWDVTSLITHHAQIDASQRDLQAVQLDIAWQEWQAALAAKLRATRVLWLGLQENLLREQVDSAAAQADRAEQDLRDGFATRLDAEAAAALLQKRRSTLLATDATLRTESSLLRQVLGLPPEALVRVVSDAPPRDPSPPPPLTADEMDHLIARSRLDLAALRAGYQSQEAKLHAAVLSQFPRIGLGLTGARDTSNVGTLGFGITLDLPIFDHAQGRIAIERATRQQLFDELAARTFDARADVARAYSDLDAIQRQIDEAGRTEARLQSLETAVADAHRQADADILQLNQVRNDLADARLDTLRLRQQEAELRIAIEVATGQLLGGVSP